MHMITNPSSRDHAEVDLGPAAGVSDRGLRHHRNEDAMALAAEQAPDGPAVIAVVCDGVSSSARPDEASQVASPAAHVLTRWLGGEAADLADDPERAPHVERYTPPGAGALLICSDGLWNYMAEGADLAGLALPKALTDPLAAAADMVKFAVDAGGADNITVVLIPYLGPETP